MQFTRNPPSIAISTQSVCLEGSSGCLHNLDLCDPLGPSNENFVPGVCAWTNSVTLLCAGVFIFAVRLEEDPDIFAKRQKEKDGEGQIDDGSLL